MFYLLFFWHDLSRTAAQTAWKLPAFGTHPVIDRLTPLQGSQKKPSGF
jgi:hypothetical protein